jgi:hypothetical protein
VADKNGKEMKKRNIILAITVLLAVATAFAQTVTNVTATQVGNTVRTGHKIIVSYFMSNVLFVKQEKELIHDYPYMMVTDAVLPFPVDDKNKKNH